MSQYNDAESATNGGQAFPCDHRPNWMHPGMTLRDYFAAKALQSGWLRNDRGGVGLQSTEEMALGCYEIADAMLAARG